MGVSTFADECQLELAAEDTAYLKGAARAWLAKAFA